MAAMERERFIDPVYAGDDRARKGRKAGGNPSRIFCLQNLSNRVMMFKTDEEQGTRRVTLSEPETV